MGGKYLVASSVSYFDLDYCLLSFYLKRLALLVSIIQVEISVSKNGAGVFAETKTVELEG